MKKKNDQPKKDLDRLTQNLRANLTRRKKAKTSQNTPTTKGN